MEVAELLADFLAQGSPEALNFLVGAIFEEKVAKFVLAYL